MIIALIIAVVMYRSRSPDLNPDETVFVKSNIPTSFIEQPIVYDLEAMKLQLQALQAEADKWKNLDWNKRKKKLIHLQKDLDSEKAKLDALDEKIKSLQEENNQL